MKSFLEFNMSNEAGVDLSTFDTIIKSNSPQTKRPLEEKSDREFKTFGEFLEEDFDWSSFHTVIKPQEIIPEKPKDGLDGKHGKDGNTPTIRIGSVKSGNKSSVVNSGTSLDIIFDFVLEKGKDGKDGRDGTNGVDGLNGVNGIDGKDGINGKDGKDGKQGKIGLTGLSGKDGVDGTNGVNGKDGKAGKNGIDGVNGLDGKDGINGVDGYTPVKGVDYFDGVNGIDGKDGYTPVKGVDYFDGVNGIDGLNGVDGYTPVKNIDYTDGKDGIHGLDGVNGNNGNTPSIQIGKVSIGEIPSVINSGTSLDVIFDFILPEGIEGKQGLQGEKGDKGDIGNTPDHEVDDFGNIRFETPNGEMGDWIDINSSVQKVVTQQLKHQNKNQYYGSGGGSDLDFIVGSDSYINVRYLNIDTESLLVTQSNGVLTIGVNPSYIGGGGGTVNANYTFNYFKLESDGLYNFLLTKPLITNSETVILNGVVLTFGVDYNIINNTVMLNHSHNTLMNWNLTIKYAYSI